MRGLRGPRTSRRVIGIPGRRLSPPSRSMRPAARHAVHSAADRARGSTARARSGRVSVGKDCWRFISLPELVDFDLVLLLLTICRCSWLPIERLILSSCRSDGLVRGRRCCARAGKVKITRARMATAARIDASLRAIHAPYGASGAGLNALRRRRLRERARPTLDAVRVLVHGPPDESPPARPRSPRRSADDLTHASHPRSLSERARAAVAPQTRLSFGPQSRTTRGRRSDRGSRPRSRRRRHRQDARAHHPDRASHRDRQGASLRHPRR